MTSSIAVAFDPDGSGFIQYPNGTVMLSYNSSSGEGVTYSPEGNIWRKWDDSGKRGVPPLPADSPVDVKLDQFLGIRLAPRGDSGHPLLTVYFSCEGIHHCAVHGANPPEHVWPLSSTEPIEDSSEDCTATKQSPDPEFLRELGGIASRGAIKVHKHDPRPVEERLMDVATITSTMHELDTKLTDWLHSLKPQ
mmetsp:Transcript_9030/g.25942  ORF Transcript_9030/g.25942 Transcript_9030/m.25942 type:complete len:193 (+) Transcript_9030:1526-2104(+)